MYCIAVYWNSGLDKRPTGHKATVQKATGQKATGQKATGQKATGQKATPLNNYVILALYCVYRRQRKLQEITIDFKATICEQIASTIFADLLYSA